MNTLDLEQANTAEEWGDLAIEKLTPWASAFLVKLYVEQPLAVDSLPYTQQITAMQKQFAEEFPKCELTVGDIFNGLIAMRKKGVLPSRRQIK